MNRSRRDNDDPVLAVETRSSASRDVEMGVGWRRRGVTAASVAAVTTARSIEKDGVSIDTLP